jgi:hypothetical protein
MWIPGHQEIVANEEADRLAKVGTNKDHNAQVVGVVFAAGKEVFRSDFRQDHLTRGVACHGCSQSRCR